VTLTDAGALVALIDKNQPASKKCRTAFPTISLPLITTWPAFTEAAYLLYRIGGWPLQRSLWKYVETGVLTFHNHNETEQKRMRELMERYLDTPMDLADASLVVAAETLNLSVIFTLDSDFYSYRISDVGAFEVLP
jgi:predicted nucleic acid-binding protein